MCLQGEFCVFAWRVLCVCRAISVCLHGEFCVFAGRVLCVCMVSSVCLQGQFCEQCAPGYKREVADGGAFVACVPCECNGHATDVGVPCEPESGVCHCIHNTQGDQCQLCADGWFGVATAGTPGECSHFIAPGAEISLLQV